MKMWNRGDDRSRPLVRAWQYRDWRRRAHLVSENGALISRSHGITTMNRTRRPRRLRSDGLRPLVSETTLDAADLIAPVFVDATTDERRPIESMPGHERVPVEAAVSRVEAVLKTGVEAVIVFGIPETKDANGSRAWADDGVVQRAVRRITAETDAYVISDVCLCEYTDHGHCGLLEPGARENPLMTVDNDRTLDRLRQTAVSQAEAGADMVAPSSMTDGMVGTIREGLDERGFESVPIMSYAAKYESAFYGPFRDAADGAPGFGDRRHYQMDPANAREASREVALDVQQGADIMLVKPALPYLDIVSRVRREFDHPVAAYNVSGEYAMLHAAAEKGWLDLDQAAHESLLSIKRAGADLILTYFAEDIAPRL
jgi:porphobilinogen synthase